MNYGISDMTLSSSTTINVSVYIFLFVLNFVLLIIVLVAIWDLCRHIAKVIHGDVHGSGGVPKNFAIYLIRISL